MANKRTGPDYLDQKPKKKKKSPKKIAQVIKIPKVSPVEQLKSGKKLDQKVRDKKYGWYSV